MRRPASGRAEEIEGRRETSGRGISFVGIIDYRQFEEA